MNAPVTENQLTLNTDKISISEIFGPTIQGEGALIGTPTIFIRTGGCDYRCDWCDTGYAVLPEFKKNWVAMDAKSILKQVEFLSQGKPLWITLSGGNPAIQDFETLIKLGHKKGYKFSMETQGSIAKPWFSLLDQLTLSPKPPSSKMKFKMRGLKRCFDACKNVDNPTEVSLKFVIANQEDLLWSKNIADSFPDIPCFLQTCNTNAAIDQNNSNTISSSLQKQNMLELIESTQKLHWHNVRILPQLHTWLWGDKTGV